MELTEWVGIPGWEDLYQIARNGRVRRLASVVRNYPNCTRRLPECELKLLSVAGNYPCVELSRGNVRKRCLLHRLLAQSFIPNPLGLPEVNHLDGCRTNFALGNLEWTTHAGNMRHAFDTGLTPKPVSGPGEMSPAHKLTALQVGQIKAALRGGESCSVLAVAYGVRSGTIGHIKAGTTWRHIS